MKLGDTIFNGNQFKNVILNSVSYKRLILGVNLVWSYFSIAIKTFKTRILADGGTYEAESILEDRLQEITPNLFDSASLVITPNGVKTSKLYTIKPNDGTGDLDVTRATTATRVNESGNIVDVPANVARIDYSTGQPAILVEPQRTNLVLRSNDFSSVNWAKGQCSVVANSVISPDGTLTADTIISDGTSAQHAVSQGFSTTSGVVYTISVFAKKNTNNFLQIAGFTAGFGSTPAPFVNFDLNNGVLGTASANASGVIQNYGNGWYRCIATFTATATASAGILFFITNSASSVRGEANTLSTSLYLWGAQLEAGSNATSYIPTTTATVTRNADVISKNGIVDLIGQTEGSILCEFERTTETAGIKNLLSLYGDGYLTNSLYLLTPNNDTNLNLAIRINSTVYQVNFALLVEKNKIALIYDTTGCDILLNGTKLSRLSLPNFPSLYNINLLSYSSFRAYGRGYLFSFWKTKLTEQQAIQLTTL